MMTKTNANAPKTTEEKALFAASAVAKLRDREPRTAAQIAIIDEAIAGYHSAAWLASLGCIIGQPEADALANHDAEIAVATLRRALGR